MREAGSPSMAETSIVAPGASSLAVEMRFIRDRRERHPIAVLVEGNPGWPSAHWDDELPSTGPGSTVPLRISLAVRSSDAL